MHPRQAGGPGDASGDDDEEMGGPAMPSPAPHPREPLHNEDSGSAFRAPVHTVQPVQKTAVGSDQESVCCRFATFYSILCLALPSLVWLPRYDRSKLPRDLIAGLVMGVMIVPMSLAYASLLGIPIHIGLYSGATYSGIYGLLGSTASLSMAPVAEVSLMLLGFPNLPAEPEDRVKIYQAISLGVGVMSLFLVCFRGGTIIRNGFARAVGNAYATAAGIIVTAGQLKDMFNVKAPKSVLLHEVIENLIRALGDVQWPETLYCVLFSSAFLAYLVGVKQIKAVPLWIPHQLVAVVVGILVAWLARLDERIGLFIVTDVPSDFPEAGIPDIDWSDNTLLANVATQSALITLIAFLQMYSLATRVSSEVNANQELYANGMCATVAGLVGCFPGSASFSGCSVLSDLKASTPLNSLLAAVLVVISAVGLTRLGVFYYLPKGVLAAIIIASVVKLVNFSHARWLARVFPGDLPVWIITFLGTLFLGVAYGIIAGMLLSIVVVLVRLAHPPTSPLGYSAERREWLPVTQDAELLLHREVHVWSFNAPCYFVNVSYLTSLLEASMKAEMRTIKVVVLHCGRITDIDASSVESVAVQIRNVEKRHGVKVVLAGLNSKVQDALFHPPDEDDALTNASYPSVDDAVQAADEFVMEANSALAKYRPFPAASAARSSVEVSENTVGFIALVSHGDRTPKQKLRAELDPGDQFYQFIFGRGEGGGGEATEALKVGVDSPRQRSQLEWHLRSGGGVGGREAASAAAGTTVAHFRTLTEAAMHRVLTVLEPAELNVAVKRSAVGGQAQIVAKWGGMLTEVGLKQAAATGAALHARLGLDSVTDRPLELSAMSNTEQRVVDTGRGLLDGFLRLHAHEQFCTVEERKDFDAPAKPVLDFQDTIERHAAELLTIPTRQEAMLHAHVTGMPALLGAVEPQGPRAALVRTAELLESLVMNVRARSMTNSMFFHGESSKALAARYAFVLARLTRQPTEAFAEEDDSGSATTVESSVDYEKAEFNATMIKAVYDNVTYDIVQNALQLALECTVDLRPLFVIVQKMYTVVSLTQHGSNPSERLVYSAMRSAGFLRRMSAAIHAQVASRKAKGATVEAERAAAKPEEAAPVHLDFFFSSAALLSALRGCVANSDVVRRHSRGARTALRELEQSGLHFFSHAVVKIVHGGADVAEEDATLEMYFSSGAAIRPEAVHELEHLLEAEDQAMPRRVRRQNSALAHRRIPSSARGPLISFNMMPPAERQSPAMHGLSATHGDSSTSTSTPGVAGVGPPSSVSLSGSQPAARSEGGAHNTGVLRSTLPVNTDDGPESSPLIVPEPPTAPDHQSAPARQDHNLHVRVRDLLLKMHRIVRANKQLRNAASSLTKVQPMRQVLHMSLREFDELVSEMAAVASSRAVPVPTSTTSTAS